MTITEGEAEEEEPEERTSRSIPSGVSLRISFQLESTLDGADLVAFVAGCEGGCDAQRTRAAGTAHAMDEIFGRLRQIEVHDMRDVIDVNTAGSDIGGHKDAIEAVLESLESHVALVLRPVAMNGGGFESET